MASFNMDNYVPVNVRIGKFYNDHTEGRILTEIVQHDAGSGFIVIKASVFREKDDVEPSATGHAFEDRGEGYVNKTSYIENCETGAVGRALAMLGYEVQKGIASREEMEKVERLGGGSQKNWQKHESPNPPPTNTPPQAPQQDDSPKPLVDMGTGPIKKAEMKLRTLCTDLNKAGSVWIGPDNREHKWNSETLQLYSQNGFDKALAQLDQGEADVLVMDLTDTLNERLAIQDDGTPSHSGPSPITPKQLETLQKLAKLKKKNESSICEEVSGGQVGTFANLTEDQAQEAVKVMQKT